MIRKDIAGIGDVVMIDREAPTAVHGINGGIGTDRFVRSIVIIAADDGPFAKQFIGEGQKTDVECLASSKELKPEESIHKSAATGF